MAPRHGSFIVGLQLQLLVIVMCQALFAVAYCCFTVIHLTVSSSVRVFRGGRPTTI